MIDDDEELTGTCLADSARLVCIGDLLVVQACFAKPLDMGQRSSDLIQVHRFYFYSALGRSENDLF